MAARINQDSSKAIYLYGITRREIPLARILGVDGSSQVESIPLAGFICWISRVPRSDFADNLQARMENLDWLAEASVHHQRVVSAIANASDILPARFGTVFMTASSLESDVRKNKRILEKDFALVAGADEFGVKVFAVPSKVELPPVSSRTGKDYLKAKAALLERRSSRRKVPDLEFDGFIVDLQRIAVATADAGKISAGQRGLEWQTSLLLRRSSRKQFDAILRKYSKQWAGAHQIECTGPWPPYSFVSRTGGRET